MTWSRRAFLGSSACALAATARAVATLDPEPNSRIDVLFEEPCGIISPDLYGYLLENLGTVIYDGIWVGEKSKIPNIAGIRKSVIERLGEIGASVIRWPGGNFADYYNWEDGIGPRAKRPRRTNVWTEELPVDAPNGPQRYDPNSFGTPEFLRLCNLSGGRPFLSVNARGLAPDSFSKWVEYCNSPRSTTTLADAREKDGSASPYGAQYWGIGNEVWAAGGNLTAQEYSTIYKRFTANIPRYGVDLCFVAAGPPPGWSTEWIHDFMQEITRTVLPVPIHAMSLHYYAALPLNYLKTGKTFADLVDCTPAMAELLDATDFGDQQWYRALYASSQIGSLIDTYWHALGMFDEKRKIRIAVDEWGAIYKRTPTENLLNLTGRGVTMRDALAASITLDVLNNNCSRLNVANYTGLINQEGGLLQADGAKFCVTPVYHVFRMYRGHQGARCLRTVFDVPSIKTTESHQPGSIARLSGSASIRENYLTLTVANPHASDSHDARIVLSRGFATEIDVTTLVHADLHAQNSFQIPNNVFPQTKTISVNSSSFTYSFPAASVTSFNMKLKNS